MELTAVQQLLSGALLVALLMTGLWLLQRRWRDATIVDVGWAGGLGCLLLFDYATLPAPLRDTRALLVTLLGAAWALRLAGYLFFHRVWGRTEEDGRYQSLRKRWGPRAQPWFFLFFQAQAFLAWLFSLPMLVVMHRPPSPLTLLDAVGLAIGIVAILGEATADAQLARFRADPAHRGRTCRAGLWRYSRHPNYFFEWLHWWAYVPLAAGSAWWWLPLAAPWLMLLFLFRITGIPATEAHALQSRGDDYRAYQRSTSPFIPWFPRQEQA